MMTRVIMVNREKHLSDFRQRYFSGKSFSMSSLNSKLELNQLFFQLFSL
jgi:hypothetical protein